MIVSRQDNFVTFSDGSRVWVDETLWKFVLSNLRANHIPITIKYLPSRKKHTL